MKLKKASDAGNRPKIGNVAFVSKQGATRASVRNGMVYREWQHGRVKKKMREPLKAEPGNFQAAFEKFQRSKKKGVRRRMMIRKANAAGQLEGGMEFVNVEALERYVERFEPSFLERETARLIKRGMTPREAKTKAQESYLDVIAEWYVIEYEEEKA